MALLARSDLLPLGLDFVLQDDSARKIRYQSRRKRELHFRRSLDSQA
jgi:hypothetical protein